MSWAQILPAIAAIGATAMSGGAAAPALLAMEGGEALAGGTALAEGAAAGAEAAGAAEAATAADAAATAATPASIGFEAGAAAPSGQAGITAPLAQANAGAGASQVPAGAGIQVPAGSTVNGELTQGGMSVPANGTVVNGTNSMSVAPGQTTPMNVVTADNPIAPAAGTPGPASKPGLTAAQLAQLSRFGNQGQQQTPAPAAVSPGRPASGSDLKMEQLKAQLQAERPSLAQILFNKRGG